MIVPRRPLLCLLFALSACGKADGDVDALDRELIGNVAEQADPALAAALEDQIMVDPALAQQAGGQVGRRGDAPPRIPVPAGLRPGGDDVPARETLGEMAERHPGSSAADCYANLAYGHGWATKLPVGVPLYTDAAVDEAAGNDRPGCGTRVVSYATAAPAPTLVAFYLAQARKAGWAAERARRGGDEVVAGDRTGAAFYVAITPRPHGAAVNIVTSGG